ncbi:MAG: Asp-tRNA(Asn)/Glu-tRNA(Gln) amidotransferase GatCAB subunit A [Mycoplasmataceae bacterium]|jgi:aspartyl-tRNA(Asn)/glutamyl-tRNA(Gln) amidotransferase subunit A|nr:Asp-tRNA(Asn)/Glu-tRNA(Gln) amidotransferase GatCAB subunit A [Mycoplasmataceae bacterium]
MRSLIKIYHDKLINLNTQIIDLVNLSQIQEAKIKNTNAIIFDNYPNAKSVALDLQKDIDLHRDNLLYGIPYSLKDNICTKDIITTGGSKFLKDFIPPYSATVYELLQTKKAILVSKSNLDEFGMGGTGLYSFNGYVYNFHNHDHITGGSSSGAVDQVASGSVAFAIGTDTGDSIRRPASFAGVVGYKPSYGLVSRYGVLPYAPSLDHVGIISSYVTDAAIVADTIIKFDDKDYTSQKLSNINLYKNLKTLNNIKFLVFDDIDDYLNPDVKKSYYRALDALTKAGHKIKKVSFQSIILQSLRTVYMIISYAEGSSCYANMTGIPFGLNAGGSNYDDIITNNRTQGLGSHVKHRLVIGAYITQAKHFHTIFQRSQKIRTLIIDEINRILDQGDCFLCPSASSIAPKIKDILAGKDSATLVDDLLLFANFAGLPSITVPHSKINNMPIGLNITCKQFADQLALNVALTMEEIFNYA